MNRQILLQMKGIQKAFPGVRALKGVDLTVHKGEVHALMGENGAGKSCLIKILTGFYKRDAGSIEFDGQHINPASPIDAQSCGISTIYQELNLIPYLSVAENIFLGREPKTKLGLVDWNYINREAQHILERFHIYLDVQRSLNSYSTAVQQMTAIAKAVSVNAKLIVMDEPTSSLDQKEVHVIFETVRMLRQEGVSVIFVSHRLDELYELCDKITVLKDGEMVHTGSLSELTQLELINKMVGSEKSLASERRKEANESLSSADVFVEAKGIETGKLQNVDFSIKRGEVVGLAGLLGAGRTELANALFGQDRIRSGTLLVRGKQVQMKTPRDAVGQKFAMCPEDRKVDGIIPNMSVKENISIVLLPKLARWGIVNRREQDRIVNEFIQLIKIKTPYPDQPVKYLSGGNQQKVILARWLCAEPEFIILDEPTRGIDVGAKAEIERLIQNFAAMGICVLMISSEMEELVRNCDRIEVMRDGEVRGTLRGDDISLEKIMAVIARQKAARSEEHA